MQGNYFLIREITHENVVNCHKYIDQHINKLVNDMGVNAAVKVEEYKPPRSLSANALYWMWMTELSNYFKGKGRTETKDDMHDLMRHKFLGWNDARYIGKTKIDRTLRSTAKLNKSEMCHYMEKISSWAAEVGCFLTDPMESEYREFLNKQIS